MGTADRQRGHRTGLQQDDLVATAHSMSCGPPSSASTRRARSATDRAPCSVIAACSALECWCAFSPRTIHRSGVGTGRERFASPDHGVDHGHSRVRP